MDYSTTIKGLDDKLRTFSSHSNRYKSPSAHTYHKAINQRFSVERDLHKYTSNYRLKENERKIYKITLSSNGRTLPALASRGKLL